ncbi:MAG TPA: trehalose-phosphatase [Actinomycetota bacterium]|nr:trehalose-phosphatase [Actinomycetota bacterium]
MSDALSALAAEPQRTGLFLDFDGTLSEIVHIPTEARPVAGVPDLLKQLSTIFKVVAVVSGRAAGQLAEWLGPDIEIWGVHGAESIVDGAVTPSEWAKPYEELMRRVLKEAEDGLAALGAEGAVLEDKGVIINLHFRAATDPDAAEAALERLAHDLADRHGLLVAKGRMSYELRAPADFSKAAVVLARARAESLDAIAFVGDDRVDLPGFDALDQLAEEGASTTCRVAVRSDEAPEDLLDRADVVLDGPAGAVAWLEDLLDDVRRG